MYRKNSQQFAIGTRLMFPTFLCSSVMATGTVIGRSGNYGLIVLLDKPLADGSTAEVLDTKVVTIIE